MDAVGVVVRGRERHFSLANWGHASITASADDATADSSTDQVIDGLATLTGGEVLATFVLGGWARL